MKTCIRAQVVGPCQEAFLGSMYCAGSTRALETASFSWGGGGGKGGRTQWAGIPARLSSCPPAWCGTRADSGTGARSIRRGQVKSLFNECAGWVMDGCIGRTLNCRLKQGGRKIACMLRTLYRRNEGKGDRGTPKRSCSRKKIPPESAESAVHAA